MPARTRISASRKPLYKIAKPPFYAAWATPVMHDTRAGLRINANCQVIDMNGEVIPGLYCGGNRRAASACTACRAAPARATSPARTPMRRRRRRKPSWCKRGEARLTPAAPIAFARPASNVAATAASFFVRLDLGEPQADTDDAALGHLVHDQRNLPERQHVAGAWHAPSMPCEMIGQRRALLFLRNRQPVDLGKLAEASARR